jgi:hypothetical protein
MKWLTSGSHRLKANLGRSFGARKKKKAAAAGTTDVGYKSIVNSAKMKFTRLKIASNDINRNLVYNVTCSDTAEMNPLQFRTELPHSVSALGNTIPENSRAPFIARQKEKSTRIHHTHNRTLAANSVRKRRVDQNQLQSDLFGAESIERIVALQEQHRKRKIEQHENRICFDDIQLADVLYQSQPTQQTLRFFNNGVEVDMNGSALVPDHQL